ncbi:DUF6468 domain-containing protein [Thalassospira sp. ER-Se-21-Dark]|uniref:DUF6468 domain-containing protein n=1 Tax=Thalassospira sp. ER-Se-21-Dark TaxID=2585190 RepID=UPI001B304A22|nr:DUF6468 domain-containing protein [Thalassospira sp. ER-Se-21-Dark]MBP3127946.1 ABC transporter ATP-binding protein [Thalassospira sp. ER-Se-21-Dark]
MDFAFYLDLVMIVLLGATIVYAIILNRKLAAFRRSREDMQNFLTAFNAANERAETSITALKEMAEQSGERLREDIEKAGALNEDLSFMVDRGESIANRLEKAARDVNSVRRTAGNAADGMAAGGDGGKSAGAGNAGLGRMKAAKDRNDVIDDRDRVGVETRAEELAARMVGEIERGGNGPVDDGYDREEPARSGGSYGSRADVSDPYDQDEDAGRSEAERELLAALRSVR